MLTNPENWQVVLVTIAIICLCVLTHYEVLGGVTKVLSRLSRPRPRMIFIILAILVAHVVEIWFFAFGYWVLVSHRELGLLEGLEFTSLPDYVYYSAVVFTTLGFGDIIPSGPIRFMTGMEALSGLVLITWSASFAFLEMQRNWR